MLVPELKRCCFCLPLRPGILIFGYLNVLLSIVALLSIIITTEFHRDSITEDSSLEEISSTVLFGIIGMGIILNVLLLIAGAQKDVAMLRLYSFYMLGTATAAFVPTIIMLYVNHVFDFFAALLVICMQFYVIILVRSEVVKLETKQLSDLEVTHSPSASYADADLVLDLNQPSTSQGICIPDHITLL